MYNKRDVIIFFAGAEAFHTLSHLLLGFSGKLPVTFFGITLTSQFNMWAIAINAAITIWLLIWASRLEK